MSTKLSSRYLGLELKNPLVAAASPLTGKLDILRRLEDGGISACVLPSLFEEQLIHDQEEISKLADHGSNSFAESLSGYLPKMNSYNTGPERYLEHLRKAKESLSIPVIASLNGFTPGGWVENAKLLQEAGADALELNIFFISTDLAVSGSDVEARYVELVKGMKKQISIPLAVKIPPFFSAPAHMAKKLVEAGADGLVIFNRFVQPDIDLESLSVKTGNELSSPHELRLPLRWIGILRGQLECSLAASTGVHSPSDVLKLVLAGADVATMASALLKNGPAMTRPFIEEITRWLDEHEYKSLEQMKGSVSQKNSPEPESYERAQYMAALVTYTSGFLS